jgi:anti-sigma factor RsiW
MTQTAGIACDSLEAYVDGELSVTESAAFDRHAAACSTCQPQLERHLRLRARLRTDLARPAASDALRGRILSSLPADRSASNVVALPRRRWLATAAAACVAAFLASGTTLYVMQPDTGDEWRQAVLSAHLRATLSDHVIDVASSDRHTVKPWFGGKTKVAPIVLDLASAGYPLLGGRLDIPQKDALPVLVYKAGPHVVSVFVRQADRGADPGTAKVDGFTIATWSMGDLVYTAVSDADGAELAAFQRAFSTAVERTP